MTKIIPLLVLALGIAGCSIPKNPVPDPSASADVVTRLTMAEADELILRMSGLKSLEPPSDPTLFQEFNALMRGYKGMVQDLHNDSGGFQPSDEIWYYRDYISGHTRGGSSGILVMRGNQLVWHRVLMVFD